MSIPVHIKLLWENGKWVFLFPTAGMQPVLYSYRSATVSSERVYKPPCKRLNQTQSPWKFHTYRRSQGVQWVHMHPRA